MKIPPFLAGLLCGGLVVAVAGYYYSRHHEEPIRFSGKQFWDPDKETDAAGFVSFSGTLAGGNLAFPNNARSFACYRDLKKCFVASIDQMGVLDVSRLEIGDYDITKWTKEEIITIDDPTPTQGCLKTTITVDRATRSILWVDEPMNQTKPWCRLVDSAIRKYTIDNPPWWGPTESPKSGR
jgi:hypothetical protein